MKVCFFNGAKLWGGGEKWHFDHALGFLQEGCEAVVVSAGNSELLKRAAAAGIRTKIFSVGNLSFLNVFKLRLIYNFFRKEKFDVLVMNFSKDLKVAAYMAKCAGIPKIVYRRGSDIPIKNTYLNRFLYGKCVTDILVNSEATRRSVLKNNSKLFPADKIKVIYNGINTRVPECTKPANEVPVVGTLSRFVYQKGIDILLDIALILKKRGVRCKIKIGGAGALKDDLLHQAKANDLLDYVDFTGFVDNPNDFMCGLDIFVLTSRWEGFGYVLAEAMLAKKPLVAFDISSNPELVFNNVNGFLIPFENKVAFADAIEELLKQPQQRIKFGNAGQAIVREKFDFETNKQLVIDYLS